MYKLDQTKTPFVTALKKYVDRESSQFDVPGHHLGNVKNDFQSFIGVNVYKYDVNAPRGLDMLLHPEGVIKQAQRLAADAFGADQAYFLVNGTSGGILAMFLATLDADDTIILPRNCHKSVINALIISGAQSVFVMPNIDPEMDIANQPSYEDYEKAILEHPEARAVFIINPTYFGSVIDLERLVELAHDNGMLALVDEAHGCHFYFDENGPKSAMECNADIAVTSVHKMGGSLTQSSILMLKNGNVDKYAVTKSLQILTTTSPNNILLASLDSARKNLATKGQAELNEAKKLASFARHEINKIKGFKCHGIEHFKENKSFNFDSTKLVIELDNIALSGRQVYNELYDKYNIQMELAETYVVLGLCTIGTKKISISNLITALKAISRDHYKEDMKYPKVVYPQNKSVSVLRTRVAFNAPQKIVKLDDALYAISKGLIMVYPPGIPLVIPGEVFTKAIIDKIKYYYQSETKVISDFKEGYVGIVDLMNFKDSYYSSDLEPYYEMFKIDRKKR